MKYVLKNLKTNEKPTEPRTVSSQLLNGLQTKANEIVFFMCCKFAFLSRYSTYFVNDY